MERRVYPDRIEYVYYPFMEGEAEEANWPCEMCEHFLGSPTPEKEVCRCQSLNRRRAKSLKPLGFKLQTTHLLHTCRWGTKDTNRVATEEEQRERRIKELKMRCTKCDDTGMLWSEKKNVFVCPKCGNESRLTVNEQVLVDLNNYGKGVRDFCERVLFSHPEYDESLQYLRKLWETFRSAQHQAVRDHEEDFFKRSIDTKYMFDSSFVDYWSYRSARIGEAGE